MSNEQEFHRVCACDEPRLLKGAEIVDICVKCDLPMSYENIENIKVYNQHRILKLNAIKIANAPSMYAKPSENVSLDKPTFNFQSHRAPDIEKTFNIVDSNTYAANRIEALEVELRKMRIQYNGAIGLLVSYANNTTSFIGNPAEIIEAAVYDWAELTGNEYKIANQQVTLVIKEKK